MDTHKHRASDAQVNRESARVVRVSPLPGGHCRVRLRAPSIAASTRPGQFVNIATPLGASLLRRPLGVYQTYDQTDIEVLFKILGKGTIALAGVKAGDELDVIGPLGKGFDLSVKLPETAVLVAGGFGVAPLHPLALALRGKVKRVYLFVGTETELPLDTSDSAMQLSFVDPDVNVTLADFEEPGVVARVATLGERPGFYHGLVTELLEELLNGPEPVGRTKIYACGPWMMLKKTASIAAGHGLPCDVLLEERMGCGIGACMSCVVRVKDANGRPAYARACVEGPVFDAAVVDWEAK